MAAQHSTHAHLPEQPQRVSLSSFQIPSRTSSAQADVPIPQIRASAPLQSRFVIRLTNCRRAQTFLSEYTQGGIQKTFSISKAKLFVDLGITQRIAALFYGDVVRVLNNVGSGEIRLCVPLLQDRPKQKSEEKQNGALGLLVARHSGDPFLTDAKQLFIEFLERRFGIIVQGFQRGFAGPNKKTPDLLLFSGPFQTTLAIPVEKLLDPATAIEFIRSKKTEAEEQFSKQSLEAEEGDAGALGAVVSCG
jgi:hypothetical protein